MPPSRCCHLWVKETLKSALKSPPNDDAHGNVQPIRRLYACNLRERRPRHGPEYHVVVGQVDGEAVEPVGDRRTGGTSRLEVGPEHEVIDKELRAPFEKFGEGRFYFVGLESVFLVVPHPRPFLAPLRQFVAAPRERLLLREQLQPGFKPLFTSSDIIV